MDTDLCDCGWPGDEELPHESFCAAVNSVHEEADDGLVDELMFEDGA